MNVIADRASGSLDPQHILYAPGIKRIQRKACESIYWFAPPSAVRAGWAPKSLRLPPNMPEIEIAATCRAHAADVEEWRKAQGAPQPVQHTIAWLINRYRSDPFSPYRALRANTLKDYDPCFRRIEKTVGQRRIDPDVKQGVRVPRITGEDFRRWHHSWGEPDADGNATRPGNQRHTIEKLRILLSYAVEIGVPGAIEQRAVLASVRFPLTGARETAPTREQVIALVNAAKSAGYLSMAIATLAQFEFTERRTHIIGQWEKVQDGQERWCRGWTWNNIQDWIITYKQTKKRKAVQREFDLRTTPALLEMLQAIPEGQRVGPVIVCETTGKPWRERHYGEVFSKMRAAAGLPPDIWSMDMRAAGATEADGIEGLTELDMMAAGGWADPAMRQRYSRAPQRRAQKVVTLRQARTGEERD